MGTAIPSLIVCWRGVVRKQFHFRELGFEGWFGGTKHNSPTGYVGYVGYVLHYRGIQILVFPLFLVVSL